MSSNSACGPAAIQLPQQGSGSAPGSLQPRKSLHGRQGRACKYRQCRRCRRRCRGRRLCTKSPHPCCRCLARRTSRTCSPARSKRCRPRRPAVGRVEGRAASAAALGRLWQSVKHAEHRSAPGSPRCRAAEQSQRGRAATGGRVDGRAWADQLQAAQVSTPNCSCLHPRQVPRHAPAVFSRRAELGGRRGLTALT